LPSHHFLKSARAIKVLDESGKIRSKTEEYQLLKAMLCPIKIGRSSRG
jgi:hypothetical protein